MKVLSTIRLFSFLVLMSGASSGWATDYIWSSATNGNYNNSGLWTPGGGPPGAGDNAFVNAAGVYTVTLNDNRFITDFTLNSSSATFAHTAGTYTVSGTMTLQSGLYQLNGGIISGGSITSGGGNGTLKVTSHNGNTLSGVNISPSVLDLTTSSGFLTLTNNVTLNVGTSLTLGNFFQLVVGSRQSSLSNVSLNIGAGNLYGGLDNASFTIGSSGNANASVFNSGGSQAFLGSNNFAPLGTNRSIINTGVIENTGLGQLNLVPSGNFTNQGTLRVSSGTLFVNPTGTFSNTGTIELLGGTLNLASPTTTANLGTINRPTPTTGTLQASAQLSLSGNYDLANSGTIRLFGGPITSGVGGPFTLSSSNASRLLVSFHVNNAISNVNLAPNVLDLSPSSAFLTLQNNTSFAAGSAYTLGNSFTLILGTGQSGISNVALTLSNSNAIYGGVDNATITLGPTGTAAASVNNAGLGGFAYLGTDNAGSPQGTNRSITNTGLIDNTGNGNLFLQPSGTFTNQGTLRITNGAVYVQSAFINTGVINLLAGSTLNLGSPINTSALGTITRATPTTGTINISTTLTLGNHIDLAGTGTLRLAGGTLTSGVGGPFTLSSSNAARLQVNVQTNNALSNVNLATNSLDLSAASGFITLANNTTFASGSAYTLGNNFELVLGSGQPNVSNLALTLTSGGGIHGGLDNSAITLGPSGTASASITNNGSGVSYLGSSAASSGTPLGTNRSIINTGVIDNTGPGQLNIVPSGSFTNQGTHKATSGTISVSPTGTASNTAGGLMQTINGTIAITASSFTNDGTITIGTGSAFSVGGGSGTLLNNNIVTLQGSLQSNLTVNNGGSVFGTGTIARALTVNSGGSLNPGNSPGVLTITNSFTLLGNYNWDLIGNTASGPGSNFDQVSVQSGNVTINAVAQLTINLGAGVDLSNPFWLSPHDWIIIDNIGGGLTNAAFGPGQVINGIHTEGLFSSLLQTNDVMLHWQPVTVPEPTSLLLLGATGFLVLGRRYGNWGERGPHAPCDDTSDSNPQCDPGPRATALAQFKDVPSQEFSRCVV